MGRQEDIALILVGLLLVLARTCAAQADTDPRTYGIGSGYISPSSTYQNSFDTTGYNRGFSSYPYSGNYYNNYGSSGIYARQVPSAVPGCQSGLVNAGQTAAAATGHLVQPTNTKIDQQKDRNMSSDPKASQTISTQSANLQQSIVQGGYPFQHMQPMITPLGSTFHTPYAMRSVQQQHQYDMNTAHMRTDDGANGRSVPPELHYIDPSEYSTRQNFIPQRQMLTYNPEDMVRVYGAGNFQPPIFSLWKRQSPTGYRGLPNAAYNYPPYDYRIVNGAPQQFYSQVQHPLEKLRQMGPLDHTNQLLPPNVYRSGKWEPMSNLQIENPVNLGEYENSGSTGYMQGARESTSTSNCREKRQIDPSWMYQLVDLADLASLSQQRAAPTIPQTVSPLTPYHGPYAPLSQLFPTVQPQQGFPSQMYAPGFTNPQAKGAVEGIQHFVSGIAQMVPVFAGGAYR